MNTRLRVRRFRLRPGSGTDGSGTASADAARHDDSRAATQGQDTPDEVLGPEELSADAELRAIRAEGLTARQLRMARRVAQKNGLHVSSDHEAVRLLRARGIDPFEPGNVLDLVPVNAGPDAPGLPQPYRLPPTPSTATGRPPPPSDGDEIRQIQRDIARRRKRRMALLVVRLAIFVLLPTALTGWYFYALATPLYTTQSEFVIQQADNPAAASGMAGLFSGTALATSQDSVTVQSFLQSRDALRRLDAEHGFRAHFSAPHIDPLLRLEPDATLEAAHRLYRRLVRIGYDPSEGVVRMEVRAADPATSAAFSRALISYAEEQVDQLTQRLREDQMRGARASFEESEARMQAAQMRVVELQERFRVLSSEVEVGLLTTQISALETQLTNDRLSLQELMANPRPNRARVDPLERRIANLEAEIASLRARLTEGGSDTVSLARISSELVMAEADVQTRQMLLAQSLQQLEAARVEANRQVRFLSLGVRPVEPDEASHPRAFENTALALLIFGGIYLLLSMTASILREQVSA